MANIRHLLDKIRKAIYGKEVRGSLADGLEAVNNEVEDATEVAVNVEQRQDAVEQQFNTLLGEWSDDKPIDNAETIAARTNTKESKTYENLGKRLDEEYGKVTSQLAQKEKNDHFRSMVNHKPPTKGCVTWIDDDGNKGFYTKLRPLALEYGVKFTSALITGAAMGFPHDERPPASGMLHFDEIMEMHNEGTGEFVVHTHNNKAFTSMTEDELHDNLSMAKNILKEHGLNHNALVYPFGEHNKNVREIVRQYFDIAFTTSKAAGERGIGDIVEPPFDQYAVLRVSLEQDLEDVLYMIDLAKEKNRWIVLYGHVDQGDWYSESKARTIIERIKYNDLEWLTLEEGVNRFGNLAQFGENSIDYEGNMQGRSIGRVRWAFLADHTPNAPITEFKQGSTTFVKVRLAENAEYGLPTAGLVKVVRDITEDNYSYREFHPYNNNGNKLYSTWNNNANEWYEWKAYDSDVVASIDYEPNAPITAFPINRITKIKVRGFEADNYGVPGYGIIDCYRNNEDVFSYQTFIKPNTNQMLIRGWDSNENKWQDWREPNSQ